MESKDGSNIEYVFRENCSKILYNLIRRHKVYIVCLIPNDINIPTNEKISDQTQFEQLSVNKTFLFILAHFIC